MSRKGTPRPGNGPKFLWKFEDGQPAVTQQVRPPKRFVEGLKTIAHKIDDGFATTDEILRCVKLLENMTIDELEKAVDRFKSDI